MSSVFTKIINREIPSEIIFENDNIIVIKDIAPRAKTHLLIIPKKEVETVDHFQENDKELIWEMFMVAKKVAKDLELTNSYQLHINVWREWGQEVMHVHMHLTSDK